MNILRLTILSFLDNVSSHYLMEVRNLSSDLVTNQDVLKLFQELKKAKEILKHFFGDENVDSCDLNRYEEIQNLGKEEVGDFYQEVVRVEIGDYKIGIKISHLEVDTNQSVINLHIIFWWFDPEYDDITKGDRVSIRFTPQFGIWFEDITLLSGYSDTLQEVRDYISRNAKRFSLKPDATIGYEVLSLMAQKMKDNCSSE